MGLERAMSANTEDVMVSNASEVDTLGTILNAYESVVGGDDLRRKKKEKTYFVWLSICLNIYANKWNCFVSMLQRQRN